MLGFLITIHAIISVLLVTVVLMQASQGGGLAGSIGGQTTNAIFGGRSAATTPVSYTHLTLPTILLV